MSRRELPAAADRVVLRRSIGDRLIFPLVVLVGCMLVPLTVHFAYSTGLDVLCTREAPSRISCHVERLKPLKTVATDIAFEHPMKAAVHSEFAMRTGSARVEVTLSDAQVVPLTPYLSDTADLNVASLASEVDVFINGSEPSLRFYRPVRVNLAVWIVGGATLVSMLFGLIVRVRTTMVLFDPEKLRFEVWRREAFMSPRFKDSIALKECVKVVVETSTSTRNLAFAGRAGASFPIGSAGAEAHNLAAVNALLERATRDRAS